MNSMVRGLLGNLDQQAGMSNGLLGGMPQRSLLGFRPFQPNFGASPFQRTPYQRQQFAPPNIAPPPQQQQAAPAQQSVIPSWAFDAGLIPGAFRGMDPRDIQFLLTAGA